MAGEEGRYPSPDNKKIPACVFFKDIRSVLKLDELGLEIARIALPAAMALTADPIASSVDTAFIGRIGQVELAAVGVSIALFNQVSRIAIFPLVSVTTSFVAEEDSVGAPCQKNDWLETGEDTYAENIELIRKDSNTADRKSVPSPGGHEDATPESGKKYIPSASSALFIGAILGLLQAFFLISGARPLLNIMGVESGSPMLKPALQYVTIRSLGAPAVLLSLATQGVFRGIKDTQTPLYAIAIGDLTNIILDPIFMFVFGLGVSGAAIAHITSQYLISVILLLRLLEKVEVLPPRIKYLQFKRFINNVWLATSLLADALAIVGQAILASSFAKNDYDKAEATASRVVQLGVALGLVLAFLLGIGLYFGAILFTRDVNVLYLISIGVPFVAGSQPINTLAFVFDRVNFGASDFAYSAGSLVMVAIASIIILFLLSSTHGFIGLWFGLLIYMTLRAFVGFWRIGTGTGPWCFLRKKKDPKPFPYDDINP